MKASIDILQGNGVIAIRNCFRVTHPGERVETRGAGVCRVANACDIFRPCRSLANSSHNWCDVRLSINTLAFNQDLPLA